MTGPPEPGVEIGRQLSHRTPLDAQLREGTLDSTLVYRGRFLEVRCDSVSMPNGATATREYIVHPGAVMVVPLLDDGRLVVEQQYRYPLKRVMLEFPAGKLDAGETPLDCAIRELAEETGYRAAEWAHAGTLHNAIAYANEGIDIWFARGLQAGPSVLDDGEFLFVGSATVDDMADAARDGRLTDAKSLIGLLWLQNWQAGRWPLVWQPAPVPGPAA